jgi:prepilin-type N-terminal cleavage/methylation domain-containing protein
MFFKFSSGGVMMRKEMMKGITLLELMAVLAISGILMGIAGFTVQGLRDRDDAESQVRQLHIDMMNARVRALHSNKTCFVTLSASGYQITEDTNESGGSAPDDGDMPLWSAPKQLKFQTLWNGTIIMDGKGIISKSTGPLLTNAALAIRFDTAGIDPEYDCISVGPTRVRAGKWNGMKCKTR